MNKMRSLLFGMLSLLIIGNISVFTASADPIVINHSPFNTSEMEAGKDYRLNRDTIINIDKAVSIGRLETANHSLIIQGSGDALFSLQGITSNTGGTAKTIQMKSGNVKVDSGLSTLPYTDAIYTSGLFRMDGGNLSVNVYRTGTGGSRPVIALDVDSFAMTAGKLTIQAGTGDAVSAYGLDIYGNDASSVIYGGTLQINSEDNGIKLNSDTSFSIAGGTVSVAAGLSKGSGYGIQGGKRPVKITGGDITVEAGNSAFYQTDTEISGSTTRVTASGSTNSGFYGDGFSVSGHPVVTAKGGQYAIVSTKDKGIKIDTATLSIVDPAGGSVGESGWRVVILDKNKNPAKRAIIDYSDRIDGLTVMTDPATVTLGKESKVKCTAAIIGFAHEQGVYWSISGQKSSDTQIAADGTLTISEDETAKIIKVTATSKADALKSGSAELMLVEPSALPSGTGAVLPAAVPAADAAVILNPNTSAEISEKGVSAIPTNAAIPVIGESSISTSGNFSKRTMTVHYAKVSGASNYIIAWKKAKSGRWKYCTGGNRTKFVIRRLKRKDLIECKVAAFVDGRIGPWSSICHRYFEAAKGSAKRSGKKLTVRMRPVKGASGYQLQYAEDQGMEDMKSKTVAKKTTIILTGLKKKTYYVRWRPIKKYKGKMYLGILSAKKKV